MFDSANREPRTAGTLLYALKSLKSERQACAWLELVPRQNSSGGKASLGRITKRGDDYLRTLLTQGAKSAVMSAGKRDSATSKWLQQLTARVGWQKACMAMAKKNARILWAVMTREQGFDAQHVSVKLQAKCKCKCKQQAPTPSENESLAELPSSKPTPKPTPR